MPLSIEWVTLLMFMTFVVLLVAGLPIAWVTGAVATIFTFLLFDLNTMVMLSRVYIERHRNTH